FAWRASVRNIHADAGSLRPGHAILAVGSFEGAPAASFGWWAFVGSAWQSSTHELRAVLSSPRGKRPRLGRTALWGDHDGRGDSTNHRKLAEHNLSLPLASYARRYTRRTCPTMAGN